MFPNLAIAGAARAAAVGQFLAPKVAQYGPRALKIAKAAGKFAATYVVMEVVIDSSTKVASKIRGFVRRRKNKENPKFSFTATIKSAPRTAQRAGRFLLSSAADGAAGAVFWLSLPVSVALWLLGALVSITLGVITYAVVRAATSKSPRSKLLAQNAQWMCSWPIRMVASGWNNAVFGIVQLLNKLVDDPSIPVAQDEADFFVSEPIVIVEEPEITLDTGDLEATPKPEVPPHTGSKVVDIKVEFDPAAAAEDPVKYGNKVRDQILAEGGQEALTAFRPMFQTLVRKSGLQGTPAVRVLSGYDQVKSPVKATVPPQKRASSKK